jgi:hypothetical protein
VRLSAPHLRGFAHLRTQYPTPPERLETRRCAHCGATLRAGNRGTLCAPCSRPPDIELPGWALQLAEHADPTQIALLGKLVRGQLGLEAPDAQPDPNAPECACGCGEHVLRAVTNGSVGRTGRYLKYVSGHWGRKEVTVETPEKAERALVGTLSAD